MRNVTLPILLFLLLIFGASNAYACSCANPSEREKFRKADYVFLGEVVDIAESQIEAFPFAVKFKVERQWKGSTVPASIVNFSFDSPGWCGDLNLAKGERFLIYAFREKRKVVAYTDCGPSRKAEYAGESIKKLNSSWFRLSARVNPF